MAKRIIKHNGVTYTHYDLGDHSGVLTFKGEKNRLKIVGNTTITTTKGSYKYGEELQFNIYADHSVMEQRANNSKYNRFEIYFKINEIDKIIDTLNKIKQEENNKNE